MKKVLGPTLALIFGFIAATLYQKTLPPPPSSPEEELERLRHTHLKLKAEHRDALATLSNRRPRDTTSSRAREVAQALKDGEEVSIDDVFNVTKPLMRDLHPLFNRIRQFEQTKDFDRTIGELTRSYDLNASQQAALRKWLEEKAKKNNEEYLSTIESEQPSFVDFVRAVDAKNSTAGIDDFMEKTLTGSRLDDYRDQRMRERVERVQNQADRRVSRLDEAVTLTEKQRDEVFGLMAVTSDDYRPGMVFEDASGQPMAATPREDRETALQQILTPEQWDAYQNRQAAQRAEAEEDLSRFGLTLPKNWQLLDGNEF